MSRDLVVLLASAALFYHAVVGLSALPPFEVVDPRGLMEVRVMESGDRGLRIALCAPQSQGTMAGRFLSEYAGSGVHQVGFLTRNIIETVKQLEANGVGLLPIPENYYDDIEARFGPEPELLDALRKHNILYDRNDHAYKTELGVIAYTEGEHHESWVEVTGRALATR